jgi:hypothetical protein
MIELLLEITALGTNERALQEDPTRVVNTPKDGAVGAIRRRERFL